MNRQSNNFAAVSERILQIEKIEASAPCRIDMGGTLDLSTFYYPLGGLAPGTFNIALNLRTRVVLRPNRSRKVRVSSRGFKTAEYDIQAAPFDHPLGLVFAVAAFFRAEGVHIRIDSASPPRSALGGSSVAAVALLAAFARLQGRIKGLTPAARAKIAGLAHEIEASVAGVPCGMQDQLAAAYGGIHLWQWRADLQGTGFNRLPVPSSGGAKEIERHLLLAYCGLPHESKDVNGRWVCQFLKGRHRKRWQEIVACTQRFVQAFSAGDFAAAAAAMNRETAIRREMTPDVLDTIGKRLVASAARHGCGARFTGAGGGGCVWAIGEMDDIDRLRRSWETLLSQRKDACLLPVEIDRKGVLIND